MVFEKERLKNVYALICSKEAESEPESEPEPDTAYRCNLFFNGINGMSVQAVADRNPPLRRIIHFDAASVKGPLVSTTEEGDGYLLVDTVLNMLNDVTNFDFESELNHGED